MLKRSIVVPLGKVAWPTAGIALLLLAIIAAPSAMAQADQKIAQSQKTASQVFWRYTRCVVRREPQAVGDLLASIYWTDKEFKEAKRLAVRNNSCSLIAGDELTMQPMLFRSSLASAAFVARHQKQPLPDYSTAPIRFGEAAVATATTPEQQQRALLLAFAECVFRNRPEEVRKLLEAEPMTEAESQDWAPLNPVLNGCLPAAPGTQLHFSRMALRGLLGEAAYELDHVLPFGGSATPDAAH